MSAFGTGVLSVDGISLGEYEDLRIDNRVLVVCDGSDVQLITRLLVGTGPVQLVEVCHQVGKTICMTAMIEALVESFDFAAEAIQMRNGPIPNYGPDRHKAYRHMKSAIKPMKKAKQRGWA